MLDNENLDPLIDTNFNMRDKFVDKYTGEVLPFRTPYNVEPDEGVKNDLSDECVISDYMPIKDQIKMFTPSDIMRINALDSIEKDLPDFDDDDLDDYISEDELDTLTNLEELEPSLFSEQDMNQSDGKATTSSTSEAQQTDDTTVGSGGSAVSPSE